MNGGTISGNTANEMGGGIAVVASIEEIGNGKWGNLESSVQILGGTICGNHANDGAGVFASAYFFTAAYAICADTPSVTAAEKPGLFIENATINNNTANQEEGYGAGVLAVMMKSPAVAEIRDCTITNNSAAVGGGVASYGNFTSLTITDAPLRATRRQITAAVLPQNRIPAKAQALPSPTPNCATTAQARRLPTSTWTVLLQNCRPQKT